MTNGKRRRISLVMLALCLVVIAGVVVQLWYGVRYNRNIQYGTPEIIEAVPYALCPGEQFTYQQSIHIRETAMVTISREWCNRGFTCDLGLHESWHNVVLTPLDFTGPVTRTVPASALWKPGGLFEFRSGVKNGDLSVQIVTFSIREDCP